MAETFPFLSYELPMYTQHLAGWQREERRLYGGDAVLSELTKWTGEEATAYAARQAQAGYLTFPKLHASTLTGHLSRETPTPEYGKLGKLRPRGQITGQPTLAEVLHYNVSGIGQDGDELLPWFDGIQERAIATGYRWIMVELPSLETLRVIREIAGRDQTGPVTMADIIDGYRPFGVEYGPDKVPFFLMSNGRMDMAVVKIKLQPESLVDESGEVIGEDDGFYVLVRRGFKGLGEKFQQGGWWKIDSDHNIKEDGRWISTRGQIPFFPFIGEPSPGTAERPSIARSLTMELGQISVSLMNRMSERNYNVMFAAKSINYILGISETEHSKVVKQQDDASITVGVPPVLLADGTVGIPTMWNSSAAAIDAGVFESVIKAGIDEAREIMVRQVTSVPDSSGLSKEAGFAEATSPLLARLAGTRQQAINTFLYFATLRMPSPVMQEGVPDANVVIPRDFNLQPIVDDIDQMLATLKRSWLRSPTWEAELLIKSGEERGLLPEDPKERAFIVSELKASATPTEPMDALSDDSPDTPGRQSQQSGGGGADGGPPNPAEARAAAALAGRRNGGAGRPAGSE